MQKTVNNSWNIIIKPVHGWFNINFKEIYQYWDLILLFVRRDFITFYKQTVLGPLWYIIQPLFNTLVFTLIFSKVAKIPTEGVPPFIFYLSGTVVWGYFAHCLNETGKTFVINAQIFGKVYFPRITVPISIGITGIFQFIIQFAIFLGFFSYFKLGGAEIYVNMYVLLLPLLILQMGILGVGIGLIISSMTAKYRDLSFAMGFFVQLWMYLTPIVYPLSEVPNQYRLFILINPMTAVVEFFRKAFFGISILEPVHFAISIITTLICFTIGIILFNRTEKSFMDTV